MSDLMLEPCKFIPGNESSFNRELPLLETPPSVAKVITFWQELTIPYKAELEKRHTGLELDNCPLQWHQEKQTG